VTTVHVSPVGFFENNFSFNFYNLPLQQIYACNYLVQLFLSKRHFKQQSGKWGFSKLECFVHLQESFTLVKQTIL